MTMSPTAAGRVDVAHFERCCSSTMTLINFLKDEYFNNNSDDSLLITAFVHTIRRRFATKMLVHLTIIYCQSIV
jgi:hypothetical protein